MESEDLARRAELLRVIKANLANNLRGIDVDTSDVEERLDQTETDVLETIYANALWGPLAIKLAAGEKLQGQAEACPTQVEAMAVKLEGVFRRWAGNGSLGSFLPETWRAVAKAALEGVE